MSKIILFGGTGHIGMALMRHLDLSRNEVVIVTRTPSADNHIGWDGKTLGAWTEALEGADVAINLAGRRVHCRYNEENLQEMMDSRVESTVVIGKAISQCQNPPKLWLQSSTATLYAHTFGDANDEATGVLGGDEPNIPEVWRFSIKIGKEWERVFNEADTPSTRKVALRSAIMMGIDKDSAFEIFSRLTRLGLGGRLGSGKQFVSWIHEVDFCRAIEFLIDREDISGVVNICSPNPLPQVSFARALREAWGVPFGLAAMPWMIAIGAWVMNGDSEIVLKSRRVVPGRLLEYGFVFQFSTWPEAARDLVARMRAVA